MEKTLSLVLILPLLIMLLLVGTHVSYYHTHRNYSRTQNLESVNFIHYKVICIFEIISLVELIETLFLLTVSYNNLFKFFFLCQAKIIIESPAPQPQPPNTLPMVSTV